MTLNDLPEFILNSRQITTLDFSKVAGDLGPEEEQDLVRHSGPVTVRSGVEISTEGPFSKLLKAEDSLSSIFGLRVLFR